MLSSLILFGTATTAAFAAPSKPADVRVIFKPGEITKLCDENLAQLKERWLAIGQIKPAERTFANTVLALERLRAETADRQVPLIMNMHVSPDEKLRGEAEACVTKDDDLGNELLMRDDVFAAIKDQKSKDPVETRLVTDLRREFELGGVGLKPPARKKLKDWQALLTRKHNEFQKNLRKPKDPLPLTAEEVKGVSAESLAATPRDEQGRYLFTIAGSRYFELMQSVEASAVRKKISLKYATAGGRRNVELAQEIADLRRKVAGLFGKKTYADLVLPERMAKTPAAVTDFLGRLKSGLGTRYAAELGELKDVLRAINAKDTISAADLYFLEARLQKQKFALDADQLKQYYPVDRVLAGLLEVYGDLLGVKFKKVEGAEVWHPSVVKYDVLEKADQTYIGSFYMDLYDRGGKSGQGAFQMTLRQGRQLDDGTYQPPVGMIVANFKSEKPSLLSPVPRGDVETLFHEFGHVMHALLTKARFGAQAGTHVKRDFVEALSQMFENWVYDPAVVAKLSGHVKTGKPLPPELLAQLQAARAFHQARRYMLQVFFASYDMTIHGPKSVDVLATYNRMYREYLQLPVVDGALMPGVIGHFVGGYGAGYYGYLWSEVLSDDMFTVFRSEGLLNGKTGLRYRHEVLEPGDSREPLELVETFLKRKTSPDAFLAKVGLTR